MDPQRTRPPAAVRQQLRQEVLFGCPVKDCGSAYLTWHHFDPPWRERQVHDVNGMVALCLEHHKQADHGNWTVEQLRQMKVEPFLSRPGAAPVGGRFNLKREQLLVRAGGVTAIATPILLRFGTRNAIWLATDSDGNELLNLDLWDADGSLLFSLRDNDWLILGDLDDVECPPAGKSLNLKLPSRGVNVRILFRHVSRDNLYEYLRRLGIEAARSSARARASRAEELERAGAPPFVVEALRTTDVNADADEYGRRITEIVETRGAGGDLATCELTGRFVYPFEVSLSRGSMSLPGRNVVTNSTVVGVEVAVRLG